MSKFALFNLFFTLVVITLGALTRLLDAGLGCPDWPGCYGSWVPGDNVNHTVFSLWAYDEGKAWMEMIHRYAASLLGLCVIAQAWFVCSRTVGSVRKLAVFLCLWVVLQGLFGMWTVTMRLWPPVVSAHLLGGAITLGIQFLIWRGLKSHSLNPISHRPLWLVFTVIVFTQMALGAWTSSQYAGLACPDFPTCQGRWWVDLDSDIFYAPQVAGDEYLGGVQTMKQRMAVQWLHRIGAIVVILAFVPLVRKHTRQRKALSIVSICLACQLVLGVLNAIWLLPLVLALLHNTFAMLLWLAVLNGLSALPSREEDNGKDEHALNSSTELVA